MPWWERETVQQPLLELILDAIRKTGGRGLVFGYLVVNAPHRGVPQPEELLRELAPEMVSYVPPLTSASKVGLKILGALKADAQTQEVHRGFVALLRALPDRLGREEYISPAEAQPVTVHAHELAPLLGRSSLAELGVVGHFLGTEEVGEVRWSDVPDSPWSIEIDHRIRRYAAVTSIYDYLRIRYPEAA